MLKRYKILLFVIMFASFSIASSQALALELNYPTLTFGGSQFNITNATSIIHYAKYVFIFGIVIAGIVAVISIAVEGAKILLYSAGGNPDAIGEARKNIFSILLGIVLLFFAFILLNTINPELVTLRDTGFEVKPKGMYYYFIFEDKGYSLGAPKEDPDALDEVGVEGGAQEAVEQDLASYWELYRAAKLTERAKLYLYYRCEMPNKNALVWLYNKKNFEIDSDKNFIANDAPLPRQNTYSGASAGAANVQMIKLDCGDAVGGRENRVILYDPAADADASKRVLSFKWDYEQPGVYFYLTKNCTGLSTTVKVETLNGLLQTDNEWALEVPLEKRKIQSVRITNGSNPRDSYGVYLTKGQADEEACIDEPIINADRPADSDVPNNVTGADKRKQFLAVLVKTNCYAIPETNNKAYDPEGAYIFHYRKDNNLPGRSTAIRLRDNYKYADLTVQRLRTFNAPAAPATQLYWKYNDNPDKLLKSKDEAQNPIQLGIDYRTETNPPACNRGDKSNCLKYLQFYFRNSYMVFLRAKGIDSGESKICRPFSSDRFIPYTHLLDDMNRYIDRMDVIPIYQQGIF